MTTGEKIAGLRKENHYTQEQLAEILEVSRQSVSKWESDMSFPETGKLIKLGKLFDCSVDYLLKDDVDESGKAVEVKIVEIDSSEMNRAYMKGLVFTYLSFPPLFGFIVGIFSIHHARKNGLKKMVVISITGVIVSFLLTCIFLAGVIFQL